MALDLDDLLRELSAFVGCSDVAVRCSCGNLEVVYVERENDRLLVTDRRETFQKLARSIDSTYDFSALDRETAREICRRYRTELNASDPEMFPRIEREIASLDDDVAAAVRDVAATIDAVYHAAMRPELR